MVLLTEITNYPFVHYCKNAFYIAFQRDIEGAELSKQSLLHQL